MMIAFEYLSNPVILEDGINCIVIENLPLLRKVLSALYEGVADEMFVLSDRFIPLDLNKSICFIGNVLQPDYGSKKISSKISSALEATANDTLHLELLSAKEALTALAEKLLLAYDYDFTYDDSLETAGLIKLLGFKPRLDAETPEENLIRFLKLMRSYFKVKLFITYGLCALFTVEELAMISDNLTSERICLLDFESQVSKDNSFCRCLIDKDLCEVVDSRN